MTSMRRQSRKDSRYERELEEITASLLRGDIEVLPRVVGCLGGRARARLRRIRGLSEADREDVLSIALYRLWNKRDRFVPERSRLDGWFFLLVRNAAVDLLRHPSRAHEVAIGDAMDAFATPEEVPESPRHAELRRALHAALEEFPEKDRRILLAGSGGAELSDELDMKPGSIRVRRHRAKEKLRARLKAAGYDTVDRSEDHER